MAKEIFKKILKFYNLLVSWACLGYYLANRGIKSPFSVVTIVFSFDRPLQLKGLLDSIAHHQHYGRTIQLVYRASSDQIESEYQSIVELYANCLTIKGHSEKGRKFKDNLLDAIHSAPCTHLLFYVDDQLLLEDCPKHEAEQALLSADIYTYRLGLNTSYCYTLNKDQAYPELRRMNDTIEWKIGFENNDINYPLSFDGTIIPARIVIPMAQRLKYKGPNTLETAMNYSRKLGAIFGLKMSAPKNQKCVNLVLNQVQSEVKNRSLEYSLDELYRLHKEGYTIRLKASAHASLSSPHLDTGFEFIKTNSVAHHEHI